MKQREHREYEPPNNDVSAGQESEYDPRNEPQPHALYNIRDPPQHAQQQYYHTERRTRANATATGTVYYHVTDRHEDAHEPGGGGRTTTPTPMWSTATCTWRTCFTDIATSHKGTIRTNTMSDLSPLSRELRVRQLEKLVRQWHGSRQSHHGWTRTLGARLRPQMLPTCIRSACTPPQPLRGTATRGRPWPRRISSRKKPPARPTQ